MKLLGKFPWLMKRSRQGTDACMASNKKKAPMGMMEIEGRSSRRRPRRGTQHQRSSESLSLLDSTDSNSWSDDAAWRVENILSSHPPSESDWWVDEESSSDDNDCSDQEMRTCDTTVTQSSTKRRRFRNIGLETFEKVNQAWKVPQPGSEVASTSISTNGPSASSRRDLMKGLANSRHYEMKQRVALHHLVTMYNEMWTEEWSD